jgi:hypothetical protein
MRTSVSAGDPIRPYLVPDGSALRVHYLDPIRAVMRAHSRLFSLLERGILASPVGGVRPEDLGDRLRQGRAPREDFEIFRRHDDPGDPWARAWEATFSLLRTFRDEVRANGANFLVVVVPHVNQVVRNAKALRLDVETRLARGEALDRLLDWNLPENRLARFFQDEAIDAELLLGPLRLAAAAGERVYGRDEHLAPRGNQVAAERVLARLALEERGPPGSDRAVPGSPVPVAPEASLAPSLLDFREDRRLPYLGDGWFLWRRAEIGRPGGWLIGPTALAVLPEHPGDLVVRGWVPASAALPILMRIQVLGAWRHRFRITSAGRFELRVPAAVPPRGFRGSADGYVAVLLAPGETHRVGQAPAGLYVEELGFASPDESALSKD